MSVVIACFNSAAWIEQALRSALGQTEHAIEVIVVDDCSTDESMAIAGRVAATDSRVRIERMVRNGGPGAARNRALELARGEWFAILDADDFYAPERLATLLDAAETHGADITADNMVVFAQERSTVPHHFLPDDKCGQMIDLPTYLDETVMFARGADYGYLKPMIRTAALRALPFAYDPDLRIGEDDDLIMRLLAKGARYWINKTTGYAYRKHDGSISHRLSADVAGALEEVAKRHEADPALGTMHDRIVRRRRAFTRARAFAELVDGIKRRDAALALRAALASPMAITMLREPLMVRCRRVRERFWSDRKANADTVAEGLLRSWRSVIEAET